MKLRTKGHDHIQYTFKDGTTINIVKLGRSYASGRYWYDIVSSGLAPLAGPLTKKEVKSWIKKRIKEI